MSLDASWQPVLPHLSALLLCFYYKPNPKKTLELGLGGGCLQRFFRYHFPQSALLSVEYSQQVINLFRHWFHGDHDEITIVHRDAQEAIQSTSSQDLIFVDLFAKQGTPGFVFSEPFYRDCLNALNPDGLLTLNLITSSYLQSELVLDILRSLGLSYRALSVPGYQNKIVFASRTTLPAIQYDANLQSLANRYGLNLNHVIAMN